MVKGQRSRRTRLTEADILRIRELWNGGSGLLQREIAELFGVTRSSIGHIVTRYRWAHVA